MNHLDDIRKIVSKTYTNAVEQTQTGSGCCSGPAPEGRLATLAGYSREALAGKVASIRVVGRKPEEVIP